MRIIAGEFRSRILLSPEGEGTRPITDRVKVALFNALSGWMLGGAIADLFCGTGSMGLEALSRGARHCWFAERDPSAVALLQQNIAALKVADRSTIWRGDIVRELSGWLQKLPEKLDVAFVDPPYVLAREWMERSDLAAPIIFDPLADVLAEQAVVVFRTPRDLAVPERLGKLSLGRRKEYGTMALNYLQIE